MAKLSILTVCYNYRHFLEESVQSSLAQTETDIELVIVDDGSTDGSFYLARDLGRHDPRIVLVRHKENSGHAAAMNTAVRVSSSPWLLKIDADDKAHPRYVESILTHSQSNPTHNVIFSPARLFGNVNETYRYPDFDPKRMIDVLMIPGPSAFRKDLWRAVGGFDESLTTCVDWDFWVRSQIVVGLRPFQLPEPLWFYRQHNGPRMSERAKALGLLPSAQRKMRQHTKESIEKRALGLEVA